MKNTKTNPETTGVISAVDVTHAIAETEANAQGNPATEVASAIAAPTAADFARLEAMVMELVKEYKSEVSDTYNRFQRLEGEYRSALARMEEHQRAWSKTEDQLEALKDKLRRLQKEAGVTDAEVRASRNAAFHSRAMRETDTFGRIHSALAHGRDVSRDELLAILGDGDVTVRFWLEWSE